MNSHADETREALVIHTLGDFAVQSGSVVLTDASKRSQRIWTLFKYIISNRKKKIPPEDFYDAIWEDEDVQYPNRALQNLIYRLRNALQEDENNSYIANTQGCYVWNAQAHYILDAETFEKLMQRAHDAERAQQPEALDLYLEALALYQGDYLPEMAYVRWVITARNQYKRLYLDGVQRAVQLLREQQRHGEIVLLCETAAVLEPFEEVIHASLLEAYLDMGKAAQAQSHYEYVTSMLYREMGVKPSAELKNVYRRMHERLEDVQMDLDAIQETMVERGALNEAFACDAETFKSLYRLEARRIQRSGKVTYLGLFTLMTSKYSIPEPGILSGMMDALSHILLDSLRRSDVVARWSESQMVVLMQSLTYEDGEMVVNRVVRRFEQTSFGEQVLIRSRVQPLDITLTPEYAKLSAVVREV